jgi:hypothetical protein
VNVLFSIYLILSAALGPRDYLTSKINEYQKLKDMSRAWPVRRADNLKHRPLSVPQQYYFSDSDTHFS